MHRAICAVFWEPAFLIRPVKNAIFTLHIASFYIIFTFWDLDEMETTLKKERYPHKAIKIHKDPDPIIKNASDFDQDPDLTCQNSRTVSDHARRKIGNF